MIVLLYAKWEITSHAQGVAAYIAYLVCVAAFSALALVVVCSHWESGWISFFLVPTIALLAISLALFWLLWKYDHEKSERVYLLVAPPVLFLFVFFMMPFAVPDEFTHINRIFDNRSGCSVLFIPSQMLDAYEWIMDYQTLWAFLNIPFDYSSVKATEFTASGYSTICYIVPSSLVSLCELIGVNGFWAIYIARLSNSLMFLAASYWMVRRCPIMKPFLLVFLLNPMLVQQECSCSADVLCNIGIMCFLVQIVYILLERKKCESKEIALLGAFFCLVVVCKFVYVPLCLTCLAVIPLVQSKKARAFIVAGLIALSVLCAAFVVSMGYFQMLSSMVDSSVIDKFLPSLFTTLQTQSGVLFWQFLGGNLGWPYLKGEFAPTSVIVPGVWVAYAILLLSSFFCASNGERVKTSVRFLFIGLGIVEIILLFYALWHGSDSSDAVTWHQGRYFIPPALCISVGLSPRCRGKIKAPLWLFGTLASVLDAVSLGFVVAFFW